MTLGKCPACGAGFLREDYCPECGHVLEEVVRLQLAFGSVEELQQQFGRFSSFETLFLPSRQPVPEGTLAMLRMVLPVPWGELTVPARVTAMASTPSLPESPYRLQLQLLQVATEAKDLLRTVVAGQATPLSTPLVASTTPPEAPAPPDATLPAHAAPAEARGFGEEEDLDLEELLRPLEPAHEPDLTAAEEEVEDVEPWSVAHERPPDRVSQLLTDFVRRLTKALTSATYYDAEHGYAQQAKVGLYDSFRLLVDESHELTFLAQLSDVKRAVLVYGVFDEPSDLDKLMSRGQADVFVPKLAGYFEAKALVSVSFKRGLEHDEFHRFLNLLATPVHLARGGSLDFAAALAAQRIENVSVVFREDLLAKRKLSWRVVLALTRLRKDLSVLPLYERRTCSELRLVRLQVVRDVIRPLRQVSVLRELLLNCDLVVQEVAWLSQEELELMVQASVTPQALPELLGGFASEVIRAVREDPERAAHLVRLTRNLARKLARSQQEVSEAVFRELYAHQVLALAELPAVLQDRIRVEDKVAVFLKAWRHHLQALELVASPEEYRRHLAFFSLVFVELLRRCEHDVAVKIALVVARHAALAEGFAGRDRLASAWMAELAGSAAGDEIVRQLLSADKLRRKSLLTLAGVLGENAVPLLFRALCDCPTRSGRQELCDLLEALKEATRRFLAAELEKKAQPWYFQRNLINLMGRVAGEGSLPLLGRFLADKHPRVRLEAILATCALDEDRAERVLLNALADPDPDICAVSLRQLVQRRSAAQELFVHLKDLLGRPEEVGLDAALQACSMLAGYQSGEGREHAVDLLLEVLSDEPRKSFWSRLAGDQNARELLKAAACQALGRLQAGRAAGELARLAEGKDKALRTAAAHALRLVQAAPAATERHAQPPLAQRPS